MHAWLCWQEVALEEWPVAQKWLERFATETSRSWRLKADSHLAFSEQVALALVDKKAAVARAQRGEEVHAWYRWQDSPLVKDAKA